MDDVLSYIREELRKLNSKPYSFMNWGLDDYQSLLLSLYLARNRYHLKMLCESVEADLKSELLTKNSDARITALRLIYLEVDTRTIAILSALINEVEPIMPNHYSKRRIREIQDILHKNKMISIRELYSVALNLQKFYSGDTTAINELIDQELLQVTKSGKIDVHKRIKKIERAAKSQSPG